MTQSRAIATRQSIIDAAVSLFLQRGYGDTTLSDITKTAGVTTGAFYHHFDSKQAVADGITAQGWPKAVEILERTLHAPSPGLENVITMTFALSALLQRDPVARVANQLNQAFGEFNQAGRDQFQQRASTFIAKIADVLGSADLDPAVTPEQVGNLVWINIHGCYLLSDALGGDVFARLALSWKVMLDSIAPPDERHYFELFVKRIAAQYD